VNRDDVVHVGRVTTAHCYHERKAATVASIHHQLVSTSQAIDGQLEPTEPVSLERIGPCQVEHELRAMGSKDRVYTMCKLREIRLISGAIVQLDIEITRFSPKRVVPGPMHRKGKHVSVAREDRSGSIALMHIAVDDRDPAGASVALQDTTGNGYIIEDAVALTAVGEGVVSTACEIGRAPFVECCMGGRNGRSDRSARALDHLRRPGKPDTPLRLARQRPLLNRLEVTTGVHEPQIFPRRLRRLVQITGGHDAVSEQPFPKARILGHWKAMPLGERQNERIGIEASHAVNNVLTVAGCQSPVAG
jgi:hypothetical protein